MMPRRPKATIGRWQNIGQTLGQGGQGQVIAVTDTTGEYDGEYALKLFTNLTRRVRIDREILVTKGLYARGAPVLPIVDDYLQAANAADSEPPPTVRPWYVTPYIATGSLEKRLIDGRYYQASELVAVALFGRLILNLKEIHRRNVAHRDLKPDNILIDADDAIYFCDLGLCLDLDPEVSENQGDTPQGEPIGSTHYMPKEAFGGTRSPDVNQFAYDIYAMGKILYRLLAGEILPGFVSHRDVQFNLFTKRDSLFYAYVNLLLDGLLHDNPQVRLDIWDNIEDNITVLGNAMPSSQPATTNTEDLRHRLTLVKEERRRRQHEDEASQSYPITEVQQRSRDILGRISQLWEVNEQVQVIKRDWADDAQEIVEWQVTPEGANLVELLEGVYVRSRSGLRPLEDNGWQATSPLVMTSLFGIKARHGASVPCLWIAITITYSYVSRELSGYCMIIRQNPSEMIDIVTASITKRTGSPYDLAFEEGLNSDATRVISNWIELTMEAIENNV